MYEKPVPCIPRQIGLIMYLPPLTWQVKRQQALYDMVYVERLPDEQQMTSGLFLPTQENPRMHICKVPKIGLSAVAV